jgi:hypothetical protein
MVMKLFVRDAVYSPGQKIGDYTVKKVSGEGRYGICYLVSDERQHYILKQLKRVMFKKSKTKAGFEQEGSRKRGYMDIFWNTKKERLSKI